MLPQKTVVSIGWRVRGWYVSRGAAVQVDMGLDGVGCRAVFSGAGGGGACCEVGIW